MENAPDKERKTVLVTGASGDIGSAVAVAYARSGWNVLAHYCRDAEGAGNLCELVREQEVECTLAQADLSDSGEISRLIEIALGKGVDALVNNAGGYASQTHYSELEFDDLGAAFAPNVFAPTLLACRLFPAMLERGWGRIVNMSSVAAKYGGSAMSLAYGSAKRALEGVTLTLAREGAAGNVLVNNIRPGVIDTQAHRKFPKDMTSRVSLIPARRMGTAQEVADMVIYLGSEKNSYITGETVTVAGGE